MAIQDVKCANCGKYLSPVWREKCLHCGVPMSVARPQPVMAAIPMANRPVRVQSVLRGPSEAACLQQAVIDGQRAAANGYAPVWQTWGREGNEVTLTILYDIVQAAPMAAQAPMPAPAPVPAAPPPPVMTAPAPVMAAPPPPPVAAPPPPPVTVAAPPPPAVVPQSWPAPVTVAPPPQPVVQSVGWAPPPVPQVIVQAPPATTAPAEGRQSIGGRILGAIISVLVVIVVYWIVAAGERALF